MPAKHLRWFSLVVFSAAILSLAACAPSQHSPILILVSFDGWRWDYIDRADVPNLRALAARGVRSTGLIPSFPSKTFPNHYTLVTGLYPEHHGIVGNNIIDPDYPERFTMASATAKESRWWGGEPIWVTAAHAHLRTAPMFWPGAEVEIRGVRPTFAPLFDDKMPNAARVQQTLTWLALPDGQRPTMLTQYFSEVDHAGHDYGPESPQVLAAAKHLDAALGALIAGVDRLQLSSRTTIVVVADHGMSALSRERTIFLEDYIDPQTVEIADGTPAMGLVPTTGTVDDVYRALAGKHHAMHVYRRNDIPASLHYRDNPRIPPILALADDGWRITSHAAFERREADGKPAGGDHGYDPGFRSMHALFVAAGPPVRHGVVAPEFQNIHVYDFLCAVLGLTPAPNDGDPAVTAGFLR